MSGFTVQVNPEAVNMTKETVFTNAESGGNITVTPTKAKEEVMETPFVAANEDVTTANKLNKEKNSVNGKKVPESELGEDKVPPQIVGLSNDTGGNESTRETGGKKSRRRRKGKGKKGKSMKRRGTRGKKAKKK